MCEWFTPHTAFYVFGRCSFGLYVNGLRLIPRFMRSDDVLSGYAWMVYARYRVFLVQTLFFRVVCEWFTYTPAFSSFIWYYFRLYV